jgi:hypothetical protein
MPETYLNGYDIIGHIADIQTSFTENFKKLQNKYAWKVPDARLQVFFNCFEVAANTRLSIGLLEFARANGLKHRDWWEKWTYYESARAFNKWPDFGIYVDDKSRQFVHRVQEQLFVSVQIYVESFLRNLARQFHIDQKEFWRLKKDFLQNVLGFKTDELIPFSAYQHLRNSLHNKGIHHNANYPNLTFNINGYEFTFNHGEIVMISWEHIRELQIATSNLLLQIVEHPRANCLPTFEENNVVVIIDGED